MAANAQTDERLDSILAEYFQSLDRGAAVSPQTLIDTNPDLAEQLREFFDAASFVEGLAGPTQSEQTQMLSANDTARSVLLGETIVSGVQPAPARRGPQGGNFPQHFGRYEIVRLLGQGAMGAVYLAHDSQLDRPVALKVPHFRPEDGPEVLERFYREARAAAEKIGLSAGAPDESPHRDLDEARRLITALAGLVTASAEYLGPHAGPVRDGLKSLQLAFREASAAPEEPGRGPGEKYTGPVW